MRERTLRIIPYLTDFPGILATAFLSAAVVSAFASERYVSPTLYSVGAAMSAFGMFMERTTPSATRQPSSGWGSWAGMLLIMVMMIFPWMAAARGLGLEAVPNIAILLGFVGVCLILLGGRPALSVGRPAACRPLWRGWRPICWTVIILSLLVTVYNTYPRTP